MHLRVDFGDAFHERFPVGLGGFSPARGLRPSGNGNTRKHNQETLIHSIWQSNNYPLSEGS
jgi:hypothetical protein